jgi:hypothetical protein
VSGTIPDSPDIPSGHPEKSMFPDDPDVFQGKSHENSGQNDDEVTPEQSIPDINLRSQEQGDENNERLRRDQNTKLKLEEQGYLDRLKSLARYYHRKKSWTQTDLLDLQERAFRLKRKMKNFYAINSHIHWKKIGLKYLLDLEDDIEETICVNEEEDPFELNMNKHMNRIFRRIEDL